HYFPFTVHLQDFTHDRYPGSNIPKNFASQVEVTDRDTGEQRETLIYMNHPLRYAGFTFFQASFAKQDTASMFQIVSNPGWLVPYIAWALVTLGLTYQFSVALGLFLKRRFQS
ncbi:MAG: cytochrome c biogenesis protein ResB, partial [Verrucomicrobiae bacterium]|nr:cytochrome c biogenesis protein ResB [Verrucomicrobiae bacterium]